MTKKKAPTWTPEVVDGKSKALCLSDQNLTDLFFTFTTLKKKAESPEVQRAKEICQQCPIRQQCQDWAMTHNEEGIWGGMTKEERDRSHRKQKRQSLGETGERKSA